MKLDDLFAKNTPLEIDGKAVEGAFIKQAPLSELVKLQDISKAKTLDEKLSKAIAIIKVCLVDEKGNTVVKSDNQLSNAYIMEVVQEIIKVNTPTGK